MAVRCDEVLEHVRQCEGCRRELEKRPGSSDVDVGGPPPELKGRIFRRRRPSKWDKWQYWSVFNILASGDRD